MCDFTVDEFLKNANIIDKHPEIFKDGDKELITNLINDLGTDKSWLEYTNHIIKNDLNKINDSIIRNEGFLKSIKND